MTSILEKWCYLLSTKNIYFNVHQIFQGDSLLINFCQRDYIYIIVEGSIIFNKVFPNRHTLTIGILSENDLLNVISLKTKTNINYYYIAEALTSTLVISYNHKIILHQPHNYILLYYELLAAHRRYITKSNDVIQVMSHRDKQCRLINLLLILCKQFGIITKFGVIINLVITHTTLGTIIGSSRTTVTRILNLLQNYKLVSIYHKKLLIHDPISLCLYYKTWLYIINL